LSFSANKAENEFLFVVTPENKLIAGECSSKNAFDQKKGGSTSEYNNVLWPWMYGYAMRDFHKYEDDYLELPFERHMEKFRFMKISEIIKKLNFRPGATALEIGAGVSSPISELSKDFIVTSLEPIETLYKKNTEKFPEINFINETLDSYSNHTKLQFDFILLSSVLHEMPKPLEALKQIRNLLTPKGYCVINVPNNRSLHRILGKELGILKDLDSLTDTEIKMQQSKNYSTKSLTDLVWTSGMEIEMVTTWFIKPNSHANMQEAIDSGNLTSQDLEDLYEISRLFPQYGSEIFMVVTRD
jgi:protein-L-isoaspartate O-methyltransferase